MLNSLSSVDANWEICGNHGHSPIDTLRCGHGRRDRDLRI